MEFREFPNVNVIVFSSDFGYIPEFATMRNAEYGGEAVREISHVDDSIFEGDVLRYIKKAVDIAQESSVVELGLRRGFDVQVLPFNNEFVAINLVSKESVDERFYSGIISISSREFSNFMVILKR